MTTAERDIRWSESTGLCYSRRGAGNIVLLVHGWCLSKELWQYLERDLVEQGHDVIAVDLAGFGASGELSGPYGFDRHAADLEALAEELSLTSVTAVGFAFGAGVLMSLLDDSRFAGLVCIGAPSAAGAPYDKMRRAMLRDWPRFADNSATAIVAREHSPQTLRWLGDMFGATRLPVAIAGAETLAGFEPLEVEQHWRVPSLFLHGADDTIVSAEISTGCATRFGGAEAVFIPDSGHLVPIDQPERLRDEIVAFVARVAE